MAASDASLVPSSTTSTHGANRQQRHEETQESSGDVFALSESICFLAKAEDDRQVRQRIANLQGQARNFRRMFAEADDPSRASRS